MSNVSARSVVVLGLTAKEHGKLRLIRRDGEPIPFELPARGVFRFEGQASAPETPVATRSLPADTLFAIALSAGNAHRLAFGTNNKVQLKIDQPVAAARIVVRNYHVTTYPAPAGEAIQKNVFDPSAAAVEVRPSSRARRTTGRGMRGLLQR
ncbi:MAG: hypothetical protein NTY19_22285 [Planctomycetota bacterium]|nr:hypothetical protein [Planctomycetota bacterium]